MSCDRRLFRFAITGAAPVAAPALALALALGVALAASLLGPAAANAQTPTREQVDSLQAEMRAIRAELDSLRTAIRSLEAAGRPAAGEEQAAGDALARLRAAAAAAADRAQPQARATPAEGGQRFVGRQRSLQALNPEISVTSDLLGRVGAGDSDRDNFVPREFEFSFVSSLDPFSRAKLFASIEEEGGGLEPFGREGDEEADEGEGGGIAVEEGYVEWVNLPGGLGVKFGRFFQQFGQLNRWHSHALPFQTRSLPHLAFIGEEALAQSGASVRWLVPAQGIGTIEATFELTRSSNETLYGESAGLSYLGHLNGFWQLTSEVDLDLGVSGAFGTHEEEGVEFDRRLYGVEAAINWTPSGRARYRGLSLRGGLMINDRGARSETLFSEATDAPVPATGAVMGLWGLAEARLSTRVLVGARYDWVENPEDPNETAWLFSPTLTWWQSEFVRIRAEYDFLGNPGNTEKQFILQVTMAMGPHKHETY